MSNTPSLPPGEDLYWRLHSLSKILEGSGVIDEAQHPDAYSTILDAMAFVRGTPQPVVREPLPASYQGSTLTSNYHEEGCRVSFSFGSVAQAEAWHESIIDQHYGITQKGGQHGADT